MIRIPIKKIWKKIFNTTLYSNIPFVFDIYKVLRVLYIIFFVLDFLFTLYSVYIAWYAIELNPIVRLITPFGALILNIGLLRYFRIFTFTNLIILFILTVFYWLANRNHLLVFLDTFLTGVLGATGPGLLP